MINLPRSLRKLIEKHYSASEKSQLTQADEVTRRSILSFINSLDPLPNDYVENSFILQQVRVWKNSAQCVMTPQVREQIIIECLIEAATQAGLSEDDTWVYIQDCSNQMLDETEVALRNCQLFEGCLARWRDKQIKYLKDSLPCTDPALFERFEQHCLTEPQSWTDLCRLLAVARTDPRYLRVSIQSCLSHQAVTNKAVQSDVSHTETPSDGLITGLSLDFLAHQNPRLSQIVSSTLLFFLGQTKQQDDNTSLRERLEPSFK